LDRLCFWIRYASDFDLNAHTASSGQEPSTELGPKPSQQQRDLGYRAAIGGFRTIS
jgi:hypothetical protein